MWDFLSVIFSHAQSCDVLVIDSAPNLPYPLDRLAKYPSWVWIDFITTCHEAITLSQKGESNRLYSAITYKLRILPLLIWCVELFIHDKEHNGKQRQGWEGCNQSMRDQSDWSFPFHKLFSTFFYYFRKASHTLCSKIWRWLPVNGDS